MKLLINKTSMLKRTLSTVLLGLLIHSTAYAQEGCGAYKEKTDKVREVKDEKTGVVHKEPVMEDRLYECSTAPVNLKDVASLQRGAQTFIGYCAGCHSAKYVRYSRIAEDLDMPPELVQQFMNFNTSKVGDTITAHIDPKMQQKWFGNAPPDLSLETRFRSPDWVYTYLLSFYADPKKPWGVNNKVFPDVAMPDVLRPLKEEVGTEEFKARVGDLVNFMTYMAEPVQHDRKIYGVFVILFLLILLIPVYFLNKEYWKDVK